MDSSWARSSGLLRIFSGWVTGRPAACAASLTAGAVSCCVRPVGRSGCETVRATSWPASSSAIREGTANWGVPQKTSFTALPLARALHFADLAQAQVALESAHAEDEQHAVEVVDLMLQAARKQLFSVLLEPLAVLVLGANAYLGVARNLLANLGKTEAAFLLVLLAVAEDDFWIDEHQLVFWDFAHAQVDHRHAFRNAHLGRGQSDALVGIGGLKHISDQAPQLSVEFGDGFAGLGKHGLGIFNDLENHRLAKSSVSVRCIRGDFVSFREASRRRIFAGPSRQRSAPPWPRRLRRRRGRRKYRCARNLR